MEQCQNLAKNLNWIRKSRGYTFAEFSQLLDVPRSTLQSLMNDGNTTLATALHISERLNYPLDALTSDEPIDRVFNLVRWCMSGMEVYLTLSAQQQQEAASCITRLMDILRQ